MMGDTETDRQRYRERFLIVIQSCESHQVRVHPTVIFSAQRRYLCYILVHAYTKTVSKPSIRQIIKSKLTLVVIVKEPCVVDLYLMPHLSHLNCSALVKQCI